MHLLSARQNSQLPFIKNDCQLYHRVFPNRIWIKLDMVRSRLTFYLILITILIGCNNMIFVYQKFQQKKWRENFSNKDGGIWHISITDVCKLTVPKIIQRKRNCQRFKNLKSVCNIFLREKNVNKKRASRSV